ncbi:MAG: YfcC family protein [Cyclobacteriaceae bacterium]
MKHRLLLSPHTIIFLVLIVAAIGTWILPAGKYDTLRYEQDKFVLEGKGSYTEMEATQQSLSELGIQIEVEKFINGDIFKPVTIPGTYQKLESNPQGIIDIIMAPVKGLIETADIIFLVLMIGGLIAVYNKSGVLEVGIGALTHRLKGKEPFMIVLLMLLFVAGGTTFGMAEETIAFYPILVPVFLIAGYDLLIPAAVILVGVHIGAMGSTTNPFAVIIASDIAGVSWTVGLLTRFLALGAGLVASCWYIISYASKVKRNPSQSLVMKLQGKTNPPFDVGGNAHKNLDWRSALLLVVFISTFIIMVIGVAKYGWWMEEMAATFLGSAILSALLMRMKESDFVKTFIAGASGLIGVSMIIGIARGVTVILQDGNIIDTILFHSASWIEGMPPFLFILALMLVYFVLTFFISSSSGIAVVTMPIMSGLGTLANIPPETIVTCYLFGTNLMFMISPTAMVLPSLSMVNVTYGTWIRFIWPLLGILAVMSAALLFADLYWI